MKKIICCIIGFVGFYANAQEIIAKEVKTELEANNSSNIKRLVTMAYVSESNINYTISGNISTDELRKIEKTALESYQIDLTFMNEKYHKNKLTYLEFSVINNGKPEIYTFGTEDLNMMPFTLVLNTVYKSKDENTKNIILRNNKNNRSNFVKEQVINIT